MRVLILGGTGLLGNALLRVLSKKFETIGTRRVSKIRNELNYIFVKNILDKDNLSNLIVDTKPDVVINCVSITNVNSSSLKGLKLVYVLFPEMLGGALLKNFYLRSINDVKLLWNEFKFGKHILIIGGGYIGLEVAASLRKKGMTVTVIEAAERILARVASKPLADRLTKLHEDNGVQVLTGVGVDSINAEAGIFESVTLTSGEKIVGDMLITGIGVFPDSTLAASAGIETQRKDGGAILVDETMRSSEKDVFAVGDVALRRDQLLAIESVHNAQETAAVAAAAITGSIVPKIQTPWFWSDQYDVKLQSVGVVPINDDDVYQVARPGKREGAVSFWSYRGDDLVAVEVVNDPATYMEARQCLDTGQSPDPEQISNLSFSPIDSGGARS